MSIKHLSLPLYYDTNKHPSAVYVNLQPKNKREFIIGSPSPSSPLTQGVRRIFWRDSHKRVNLCFELKVFLNFSLSFDENIIISYAFVAKSFHLSTNVHIESGKKSFSPSQSKTLKETTSWRDLTSFSSSTFAFRCNTIQMLTKIQLGASFEWFLCALQLNDLP